MISYNLRSMVYSAEPRWQIDAYADYQETRDVPEHKEKSINYNRRNAYHRWDSDVNNGARGMPTASLSFPSRHGGHE